MQTQFDYNEYDSLSLALKENEAERLLGYYKAFGWEEYEKREDKRYFDIIHIKLKRKHKIPNKDRLQLLQVKMEATVNRFAFVRKNKHSRSVIMGLTLGTLSLGIMALGIWLLFTAVIIPLAIALIFLSAVSPVVIIPLIRKAVIDENEQFAAKFKEMTSEISRILLSAKRLYGGENDD